MGEVARLHREAIAALAAQHLAAVGAAAAVYVDVVPPDPAWPYVVWWSAPAAPWAPAERMAGWGGEVETTTQGTVAGLSPDDVLGLTDRLVRGLHRRRPVVPGRAAGDIDIEVVTVRPDRDPVPAPGGQDAWTGVLMARLVSSPTSQGG